MALKEEKSHSLNIENEKQKDLTVYAILKNKVSNVEAKIIKKVLSLTN